MFQPKVASIPFPGVVLYELQSARVQLANLIFEKDPSKKERLLAALDEAKAVLRESRACLKIEPPTSPVFNLVLVIEQEMEELDNYVMMVKHLQEQDK